MSSNYTVNFIQQTSFQLKLCLSQAQSLYQIWLILPYCNTCFFKVNYDYNQLINMSSKASSVNVNKYLAIGGGLLAAYLLTSYLAKKKPTSSKTISLDTTLTLLKEIKYQVYASCIAFSEGVNAKTKASYPQKDLEVFLRTELGKVYDSKEELILSKHGVSRDQYGLALQKYKKEKQVEADQAEILRVLEDSVRGKIDLSVPAAAAALFSSEQLIDIYRAMCLQIGIKVWEKLLNSKRNNPLFDSKTDAHFKAAIRELGIYEFKVAYLADKGLRAEWGCPNLVFLKLLEGEKQKNQGFKLQANYIEKGYEAIISKVSNDPDAYDRLAITRLMEDTINEHKGRVAPPVGRPVQPAQPVQPVRQPPPPPIQPKQVVPPKPVQKAPQNEDDYMEQMMMQELLSRSQEEPKVEPAPQKVKVKPVEPVVEVKPVQEKQQEQKPAQLEESAPIVESILVQPAVKEHVQVVAEVAPVEPVIEAEFKVPEAEVAPVEPVVEGEVKVPEAEHKEVEIPVEHVEEKKEVAEEQIPVEVHEEIKPQIHSQEVENHDEPHKVQNEHHQVPQESIQEPEVAQPAQAAEVPQQENQVQLDQQNEQLQQA